MINADAAQVYACWRVLTARPGDADAARARRTRSTATSPAPTRYSVGDWLRELAPVLADARAPRRCGRSIVGGTGLYLERADRAAWRTIPAIPPESARASEAMLRAGAHRRAAATSWRARDPATLARIDRDNPMRVQRAWEVLRATGRGLADWQRAPRAAAAARAARRVASSLDVDKHSA